MPELVLILGDIGRWVMDVKMRDKDGSNGNGGNGREGNMMINVDPLKVYELYKGVLRRLK